MKIIGNPKKVGELNFWGKYREKISKELVDFVFEQFLSSNTLHIYCDSSARVGKLEMTAACSYVHNTSIIVKHKFVYPPNDCISKTIYSELEAIIFALNNYKKYLTSCTKNVLIYSDVNYIEGFLNNKVSFNEKISLIALKKKLQTINRNALVLEPNIEIEILYLPDQFKKHNPFANSTHNSAKCLLNRQ